MTTLAHAYRALDFAKAHDWGTGASIGQDQAGDYKICGLHDRWTQRQPDGTVTTGEAYVTLPATISAMRDFGGY